MRIAITDFDGTLYQDHMVSQTDIDAIHEWRQAGDLFGIATGRDRSMTVHEIQKWKIPFDFLVCNNGAVVYDQSLAILTSRELKDAVAVKLLVTPAAAASVHWQFCIDGVVKLFLNTDRSWFPLLGVPYDEISKEQALSAAHIQQISFAYDSDVECAKWVAWMKKEFTDDITLQPNAAFVDMTGPGISKATGIADLLSLMHWDPTDIYVIGDAENDLAMIRAYAGFTVPHAGHLVKEAAKAIYPGVGAMLTTVQEGFARHLA